MSRRRGTTIESIDWVTACLYAALVVVGFLMIYAAGYTPSDESIADGLSLDRDLGAGRQLIWIGVSLVIGIIAMIVESRFYQAFAYLIYGVFMVSLIGVIFLGTEVNGATSWINVGGFRFQPSEFAKFATCLALANYLSGHQTSLKNVKSSIPIPILGNILQSLGLTQERLLGLGILLFPAVLTIIQGDAGTALVFLGLALVLYREGFPVEPYIIGIVVVVLAILALIYPPAIIIPVILCLSIAIMTFLVLERSYLNYIVLLVYGASLFFFLENYSTEIMIAGGVIFAIMALPKLLKPTNRQTTILLTSGLVLASIMTSIVNVIFTNDDIVKPHQRDRIYAWIQPSICDPQGARYNVDKSIMTIGAGGFDGQGYLEGNLTQGKFVPEQSTDFIFCTVGEEQGFVGSFSIITLFVLLLVRITMIAERQRSRFTRVYAYGVASILYVHFLINIGMTIGVMPVIGIPLPFMSYGGSSLISFTVLIAILLRLDSNRLLVFR